MKLISLHDLLGFSFSNKKVHIATNVLPSISGERNGLATKWKWTVLNSWKKITKPENPTPKPNNNPVTWISNARNGIVEREIYFGMHLEWKKKNCNSSNKTTPRLHFYWCSFSNCPEFVAEKDCPRAMSLWPVLRSGQNLILFWDCCTTARVKYAKSWYKH